MGLFMSSPLSDYESESAFLNAKVISIGVISSSCKYYSPRKSILFLGTKNYGVNVAGRHYQVDIY